MGDRAPPAVRSASAADAPRLAELLSELGYPASVRDVSERPAYWLPDQGSRVLVAQRGGRIVGCISLHAIPYLERTGRWLRIESVVVMERERRAGTGRALVAVAEQLAGDWNFRQIEVTSLRSRSDAHAFYRRLGVTDACERSG